MFAPVEFLFSADSIVENKGFPISISGPLSTRAEASAPWKHEYYLRGDEAFQAHSRQIIETGITAPSGQGEVYYAGPSDDVQGIINMLGPGDTLYLRGGVYSRKVRL